MNLLSRLKSGLSKSSNKITEGVSAIFTKRKLDAAMLEALEELLITADMGAAVAAEITAALGKERLGKELSLEEVRAVLAEKIAGMLRSSSPAALLSAAKPTVIMVVGVNGNGKTTTIGKLASKFKAEGKKVMLAAADTFRAAAVEQLQEWGRRSELPVITGAHEADPASVAFAAYEKAKAEGADVLLIDTAGRLHNKANLMAELQKISKVLKKIDEAAPHHVLMVLDATTGQNAISQLAAFKEMVQVDGLIVTKLDGTAKGGVIVALAKQFQIPLHAIGVGESIDDLQDFQASEFARNLVGLP
ncbi:MAG: signal recognition particle-docking protein FtsY [Alphaproteobacteria bacterium]|nr:signal recognition particle-docking protein FtsY [Alphaproteobacteria bacterium]